MLTISDLQKRLKHTREIPVFWNVPPVAEFNTYVTEVNECKYGDYEIIMIGGDISHELIIKAKNHNDLTQLGLSLHHKL